MTQRIYWVSHTLCSLGCAHCHNDSSPMGRSTSRDLIDRIIAHLPDPKSDYRLHLCADQPALAVSRRTGSPSGYASRLVSKGKPTPSGPWLGLTRSPRFLDVYSGEVSAVVAPWGKGAVGATQAKEG